MDVSAIAAVIESAEITLERRFIDFSFSVIPKCLKEREVPAAA